MPSCVSRLILISFISLIAGRPLDSPIQETRTENTQAELESQHVRDVTPIFFPTEDRSPGYPQSTQRKVQENTKEILEKIAEVNKKHGLTQKKFKPNYFHFPFSYSRSKNERNTFKFSKDPFSNPILDYIEKRDEPRFKTPSLDKKNYDSGSFTDTNPPDDHLPGQHIKRKITHYQSFILPNPYIMNIGGIGSQFNPAANININQPMYPISGQNVQKPEKNHDDLRKDTLKNIKEVLSGNVHPPSLASPSYNNQMVPNNPYQSLTDAQMQQHFTHQFFGASPWLYQPTDFQKNQFAVSNNLLNNQNYLQQMFGGQSPALTPNQPTDHQNLILRPQGEQNPGTQTAAYQQQQAHLQYLLSMKNLQDNQIKARQNWNWPGANWFPIYIRDPFLQMYYAVTNMIEYGPNSGNDGPCKLTPRPQGSRIKYGLKTASAGHDAAQSKQQVTVEVNKRDNEDDIKTVKLDDSVGVADDIRYLDVEDIDLGDDDLLKLTISFPSGETLTSGGREITENLKIEKMGWDEYLELRNDTKLANLISGKKFIPTNTQTVPIEPKQVPPASSSIREPVLHLEELEDALPDESEKAEDISIANQGSRKVFSKDNTGNGIFIHKLKVSKGGVAIAGPGGIATAGSGGTAIVGPNGIAYTHPNGLAIAGSGTKVVSVDPKVDLNDVIKDSVQNGTHHVNSRVGKVVAIGPVVYYNRGD